MISTFIRKYLASKTPHSLEEKNRILNDLIKMGKITVSDLPKAREILRVSKR